MQSCAVADTASITNGKSNAGAVAVLIFFVFIHIETSLMPPQHPEVYAWLNAELPRGLLRHEYICRQIYWHISILFRQPKYR